MDFIKMIMELPGEKRSQDVVEHTEWNSLWKLIVTQGNHSENYLEQLYDYFFNKEGWVHKVQAELDGVQPYLEGVMTQPVGKAPDGSLWTYPSTESGTVPWGNVMGDITKQQDLIQKFNTKSDVGHGHDISTLTFTEGDIDGAWLADGSIGETAYGPKSVPTSALKDLSVTSEKINNGSVTTAKIASSAVINDNIANGSVSGAKIAEGTITRVKLARDALNTPVNLLDNSDFTCLVIQAGIGGNHGTITYAADRWILDSGTVSKADVGLTLNGTIRQKLEFPPTGEVSAFVGMASGTASISYADGAVTITSNGGVLKWAALYNGAYSAATMPKYQPKGYAVELMECRRYFYRYESGDAGTYVPIVAGASLITGFTFPIGMRTFPSIDKFKVRTWTTAGFTDITSRVSFKGYNAISLKYIELNKSLESNGLAEITADFIADL